MPVDLSKVAIRGATQEHLEIYDIRDNLIILKDGSVTLTIQTTAVNFGLLSEMEQDAIIYAYAGLLNSLTFPIQIVIRSKRKDISSYVSQLQKAEDEQQNALLKNQIAKYRDFIVKTVKENNVLDKKFYICIPFSSLELGVSSSAKLLIKQTGLPLPVETIIEKAKVALAPKAEHIYRQLGRLGLRARQLNTQELIELFYTIYNPGAEGTELVGSVPYTSPAISTQ